jgi:ParB-like chromosome segregation protein Spo0J
MRGRPIQASPPMPLHATTPTPLVFTAARRQAIRLTVAKCSRDGGTSLSLPRYTVLVPLATSAHPRRTDSTSPRNLRKLRLSVRSVPPIIVRASIRPIAGIRNLLGHRGPSGDAYGSSSASDPTFSIGCIAPARTMYVSATDDIDDSMPMSRRPFSPANTVIRISSTPRPRSAALSNRRSRQRRAEGYGAGLMHPVKTWCDDHWRACATKPHGTVRVMAMTSAVRRSVVTAPLDATTSADVLPSADDALYSALKADIANHGILDPVQVSESGTVLDGRLRVQIAKELGIECPVRIVPGSMSPEQENEYRILWNVRRRSFTPLQVAELAEKLAALRGVRLGTGGRQAKSDTVAQLAADMGITVRTLQRNLKHLRELRGHPDLIERVNRGELVLKRAVARAGIQDEAARRRVASPPKSTSIGDGVEIVFGRFQEALKDVEDGSVALIVTDPVWRQWDDDSVQLYEDLEAFATRVLRPGGVLVLYSGVEHFVEPLNILTANDLVGFCIGALLAGQATPKRYDTQTFVRSTPIWYFGKGAYQPRHWFNNTVQGDEHETQWHPWQKPLAGFLHHVEVFTEPGDLVYDPHLGGGTAAVAAARSGRRFIGCDSDPLAVEDSIRRLEADSAANPA